MATFLTNFSEFADSTALQATFIPGWVTSNFVVSLEVDAGATGGKVMRLDRSTGGHSGVYWSPIGSVSGDVEIVIKARTSAATFNRFRAIVQSNLNTSNAMTGYYAEFFGGTELRAHKWVNGTSSLLANPLASFSANTWYWMRVQRTGTILRVRRWADSVAEPGTWDVSATDSSLSSGYVGVGLFNDDGYNEFDVIGVGTAGDPAPTAPLNTAPTVTVAPTVSYGTLTRLGPNNSPATVTFTATDPEQTGAGALSWSIRTASAGSGTLVGSGTCTSGVAVNHSIANSASGLVDGSQTLFLRISDGSLFSADSTFVLLRDTGIPTVTGVSHSPNPVTP